MVAISRLIASGPTAREVWGTLGLSVLLHVCLTLGVVLVPRFQVGTYLTIPVSYTVSLVSEAPGPRAGGAAPPARTPAAPAPAAPPAPRAAPPAPAPPPTEELTLPGRRTSRPPAPAEEPSLVPPSLRTRPAPAPRRAAPATPSPAPPVPTLPAAPPAPVAPAAPPAPAVASVAPARGQGSGIEVAKGEGGGSALGYYLTLVDWKIREHWVALGGGAAPETVAIVRFRVLRSGQVRDILLEQSSGSASLDHSALRAIRQSLPLPPFPNLLLESSLDLRYRFVMERNG